MQPPGPEGQLQLANLRLEATESSARVQRGEGVTLDEHADWLSEQFCSEGYRGVTQALLRSLGSAVAAGGDGIGGQPSLVDGAECLALLADALQQRGSRPRAPRQPGRVRALCRCALALHPAPPGSELARLVLGRYYCDLERYSCALAQLGDQPMRDTYEPRRQKLLQDCRTKQKAILSGCVKNNGHGKLSKDQLIAAIMKDRGDSPTKYLSRAGVSALKMLGGAEVTLADAHLKLVAQDADAMKVEKGVQHKLNTIARTLDFDTSAEAVAELTERDVSVVRELLLPDPSQATVRIGGWNAMASLHTHGLSAQILRRKAQNVARMMLDTQVSVMAVSECPGAALQCRTVAQEQAMMEGTWHGRHLSFGQMLVQELQHEAAFHIERIQIPCVKVVVDVLGSGPEQQGDDEGGDAEHEGQDQGVGAAAGHPSAVGAEEGLLTRTGSAATTPTTRLAHIDVTDIGKVETQERDMGESHYILWDSVLFRRSTHPSHRACSLAGKVQGLHWHRAPAMVVLQRAGVAGVAGSGGGGAAAAHVAVLSVHLKSGGGRAPAPRAHRDDACVVIGDFNLSPNEKDFGSLRALGFRYAGDPRVATNQEEFLLSADQTEGAGSEVYDSAWVWCRRDGDGEGGVGAVDGARSSWVWQDPDLEIALSDRAELMRRLQSTCSEWKPRSRLAQEMQGLHVISPKDDMQRAVRTAVLKCFKSKVNRDWSDHKPIVLSLSLPVLPAGLEPEPEPEPEPERSTRSVQDPSPSVNPAAPKLVLTYLDIKGLAEPIRLVRAQLLAA
jgi:hypothetical protein